MALYPTKVLLDKNKKPFIPFVTAESILFNNTDKSLADMLYERYTKEEVDNIIKNLGTVQVLRGRVDTYEDLLAVENPQAGDMYIVGTSETDNAEYIYIGTAWEKLGPLLDTTNLATLDDLENLADATITYNGLAARPTFEQTHNLIDSAINGTKDTRFLKYIGHYTDESAFPFAGQESAALAITNPYTYTSDLTNPNFDIEAVKAIVAQPYFIGTYVSPTEYSLIGFNKPEQLNELHFLPDVEYKVNDGGVRTSASVVVGVNFINITSTDRIWLYSSRTSATSSRFTNSTKTHMCWYNKTDSSNGERDTPRSLYSSNGEYFVFLQSAPNICCNIPNRIFNYVKNTYGCLKVKAWDNAERFLTESSKIQMVLQFADNFVYDIGMALLKFDENCQPVWFTAEGECAVNDVLSYGDQGDYRRFSGEAWVPMGIQSSDVFSYVDDALGTAEAAVDAIIDGGA